MPEENPVPTPAPQPTPTPTPEPVAPAPAAEPAPAPAPVAPAAEPAPAPTPAAPAAPIAAAPVAPAAPAKPKTGLIIGICSAIGVALIGAIVAVVVINNNNKPKNAVDELTKSLIEVAKGTGYDDYDDDDFDYDAYDKVYQKELEEEKANSTKTLTKCSSASDCMENIETGKGITVEQYNKAIGFSGKLDSSSSEYSKTYVWTFSNGDKFTARFSDYSDIDIEAEYEKSAHTSTKVDLDGYDDLADKLEAGQLTYNELKRALGGVDGLMKTRYAYSDGTTSYSYLWVGDTANKYLSAYVEDGIVTSVTGRK